MIFFWSVDILQHFIFFKFRNNITVLNSLNPDQAPHSVKPDLEPTIYKGYQQMTKFAISRQRFKKFNFKMHANSVDPDQTAPYGAV